MLSELQQESLFEPVLDFARRNLFRVQSGLKVGDVHEFLRLKDNREFSSYFYVVDEKDRLVGVVPAKSLLRENSDLYVSEIMERSPISLQAHATLLQAKRAFASNRLSSLPIVDQNSVLRGVIDRSIFRQMGLSYVPIDSCFGLLGFQLPLVARASYPAILAQRLPWLIVTIGGGILCALAVSIFSRTIESAISLCFYLPMIVGISQFVCMQSMMISSYRLMAQRVSFPQTLKWLGLEFFVAIIMGALSGLFVGCLSLTAGHEQLFHIVSYSVGCSVLLSGLIGSSLSTIFHLLDWETRIPSGPFAIAIVNLLSLICYLWIAQTLISQ